jgi:hypothetical protein
MKIGAEYIEQPYQPSDAIFCQGRLWGYWPASFRELDASPHYVTNGILCQAQRGPRKVVPTLRT